MTSPTARIRLSSGQPGSLPPEHGAVVAGVPLPAGCHVRADPHFGGWAPGLRQQASKADPAPRAWLSDTPVPEVGELWWPLAEAFAGTGLWPVVADGLQAGELDRPWRDGEFAPLGDPSGLSGVDVLRRAWPGDQEGLDVDRTQPFRGPAPAAPGDPHVIDLPRSTQLPTGALLLVPVLEPADVPARLGWMGAVNHDLDGAALSAVLRSWQRRYGAVPVGIGFDTLTLAVHRGPEDPVAIGVLAQEHHAFCPDNVNQGSGSIESYAAELMAATTWTFWWD